jgi:hypothetical protein
MPDEPIKDPGVVWRNQPKEKLDMNLQNLVNRRTQQLHARTQTEIIGVVAAVLFMAMLAWRFPSAMGPFQLFGFALLIVWILGSLYWFRDRVWRRALPADSLAMTGLEYYRRELERRREHLKKAWLWQSPLLLACLIFVVSKVYPNFERLKNALPFIILLAIWTVIGIGLRRREDKALQGEIAELEAPPD